MKKSLCLLTGGVVLGVMLAMQKEEEIDDLVHDCKKIKRRMMREYKHLCGCK